VSARHLPAIPRPPHDPTSLLLDHRLGWPVLDTANVAVRSGGLELDRSPGSLRWLTEPSGSFGGLRPPANVAVSETGSIWLLDKGTRTLKRFDPCRCDFEVVPCFGGGGAGARQLSDPGGIALGRDDLFVSDAGNARLSVFALPSLALRGHWRPPMPWQPEGVAVDGRGRVLVADPLNGMVHRFSRRGAYLGSFPGVGASTHLALDGQGAIFAAGPLEVFRITSDGSVTRVTSPADDLVGDFPHPPFPVDASGAMHLGDLCLPPRGVTLGLDGEATPPVPLAAVDRYERAGVAILGPLDSLIDGCVWHRLVLRGSLPRGARVDLETFTSDAEVPPQEVLGLPAHAWESRLSCLTLHAGGWDGLVRSPGGRYLWIRLRMTANGRTSPRLESAQIEFPRISLRRYLPGVYASEPVSADLTDRLLALFDRPLRDIEHKVDNVAALFDPRSTPFPEWLASWIGVTLDAQLPEGMRRQLLARAANGYALRGTREGLWRALVGFLGMEALRGTCRCELAPQSCRPPVQHCPPAPPPEWRWDPPPLILEHYRLRRWFELGVGRLGDQAVLWGKRIVNRSQLGENAQVGVTQLKGAQDPYRDPFHVYAHRFTVFVPASAGSTEGKRRSLARFVRSESPAHTQGTITYVEPRLRIGFQSMIGLDTVVARVPRGVTLGDTPVGPGSVLTGSDEARIGTGYLSTTAQLG
jgi:phage tail-like protein